jgi:hypothetical protein
MPDRLLKTNTLDSQYLYRTALYYTVLIVKLRLANGVIQYSSVLDTVLYITAQNNLYGTAQNLQQLLDLIIAFPFAC